MRISTAQIYDAGNRGMSRNQVDLFKLQNQMSTGRRMLTPSDDPIAASQALVLTQSKEVSAQYLRNQDGAKGRLSLLEGQISAVGDLMQYVREKVVQAGNATLSDADRGFIAKDLEGRFSELLGIANSEDGTGSYLFSGYQGAVRPFDATTTGANYAGDDGQRLVQVEASRQMATSVSGEALFGRGNGAFVTDSGSNQGSASIDKGGLNSLKTWSQGISDPGLWYVDNTDPANPVSHAGEIGISFVDVAGVTNYQLTALDSVTGLERIIDGPKVFTAGQPIPLVNSGTDLGASVTISGVPTPEAPGMVSDTFSVNPSTEQNVFATLRNTINMLTEGISSAAGATSTDYAKKLASNLLSIDQAMENILNV
ncbi:MAG: flagellar hook-associated protein FlgL, partial [Azonexus sp.]|nr:flagellar hook-associated protein FlgL [Azonexus sp.]